jgi:hypothetical protein
MDEERTAYCPMCKKETNQWETPHGWICSACLYFVKEKRSELNKMKSKRLRSRVCRLVKIMDDMEGLIPTSAGKNGAEVIKKVRRESTRKLKLISAKKTAEIEVEIKHENWRLCNRKDV